MNKLALTIFLLAASSSAQLQWSWQNPFPQGNILSTISFVDSANGWTSGFSGILMRTSDGGSHWRVIQTPLSDLILQHSFISPKVGWILYYPSNKVYRTTDGGLTWDSVSTPPTIPPSYSEDLRCICFIDDSVGMVGGWYGNILRTIDGGLTWEQTPTTTTNIMIGFQILNHDTVIANGNSNAVFSTANSGASWTQIPTYLAYIGELKRVFFLTPRYGWLAGIGPDFESGTAVGVLAKTSNTGISWQRILFPNCLNDVYFSTKLEGWVCDIKRNIYHTTDGGDNWAHMAGNVDRFSFIGPKKSWGMLYGTQIASTPDGWNSAVLQTSSACNTNLFSIAVLNADTAYACGSNATIIGTTNRGNTWKKLHDSTAIYDLTGISCMPNGEIWSIGGGPILFHSTDRGQHWENRSFTDTSTWYSDITFVNDTLGFIVGGYQDGILFRTTNRGRSWEYAKTFVGSGTLNKISFSQSGLGWIAASHCILRSTDIGENWIQVYLVSFAMDISTKGDSAWFPAGNGVLLTPDAGKTWESHEVVSETNVAYNVDAVSFADALNGWATIDDGRICRSTDGGQTWAEENLRNSNSLFGIRFQSPNNGWGVGMEGAVLHYGEVSTFAKPYPKETTPFTYLLYQNYPNPFNPSTMISFDIPVASHASLFIYDELGRKVTTLLDDNVSAGHHSIEFTPNHLPSGVYFCRLNAGGYYSTNKMLLIK